MNTLHLDIAPALRLSDDDRLVADGAPLWRLLIHQPRIGQLLDRLYARRPSPADIETVVDAWRDSQLSPDPHLYLSVADAANDAAYAAVNLASAAKCDSSIPDSWQAVCDATYLAINAALSTAGQPPCRLHEVAALGSSSARLLARPTPLSHMPSSALDGARRTRCRALADRIVAMREQAARRRADQPAPDRAAANRLQGEQA